MLIKIDCREKDLLDILVNIPAPPTPTAPEPDHYLMDLGDGMTMKVPLPKTKPPQRKSLSESHSAAAGVTSTNHEIKSERLPLRC